MKNKQQHAFYIIILITGIICGLKNKAIKISNVPAQISKCSFTKPDTSVYEINIEDSESSIRKIGKIPTLKEDTTFSFPYISFNSADDQQVLTLLFQYGDTKNSFAEFEVTTNTKHQKNKILPAKEFITNNKIKLGLTKSKLINILGNCFTVSYSSGKELIRYKIDNFKNSSFLKRYNTPEYYAEYEFIKGNLSRFKFGFEYP